MAWKNNSFGAGAFLSGALGTTGYSWSLSGADTQADLDGKTGSYAELSASRPAEPDKGLRSIHKARQLRIFRFTVTGMAGTGFVQINELSLIGAERIKPAP
jgi:hypothetical protein